MSPDGSHDALSAKVLALQSSLEAGLIGRGALVERMLIALLCGGHLLVEGAPGLAKTRAANRLAGAIDGEFARIQCTPDLLPSDLTGTEVFRPETGSFTFEKGPVFHNLILVDEINRAPPKVQSALLEAMGEGQVTSAGVTHSLPDPFTVVATQNPIEHEGTFPLPEAQMDRFLMHVLLDLPDKSTEAKILDLVEAEQAGTGETPAQISLEDVKAAKKQAMAVHLSAPLKDYIVRLVMETREGAFGADIDHPVSPRGSLALATCAKARAYLHGRDHAMPEDVAAIASDALAHRLVVSWAATSQGRTARAIIADILKQVEPL